MRLNLRSRPLRFIIGTLAGWGGLRAALLVPWVAEEAPVEAVRQTVRVAPPAAVAAPLPPFTPYLRPTILETARRSDEAPPGVDRDLQFVLLAAQSGGRDMPREGLYLTPADIAAAEAMPYVPLPPDAPVAPLRATSRWTGSAWAYVRQGSGPRALASGGQLGGSQAGVRIAYRLGARIVAAGRLSAALGVPGREAALGIDWLLAGNAARLSAERRFALDAGGRDAWAAYLAGGFYGEGKGLVMDGYGQAGVVGANRRDLFADGAVRVVRPVSKGAALGGGVWGAAQPGVSRLDIGPRAALRLPGGAGVLAVEQRFKVAGDARPGSGVALTLAKDF
ncbi:hypothetical protein PQ455_18420 [Sphingomonas naphthae]|uniref:DUF2219 family protein n=1 Tax=Sphingomonas naphthae TaxID=1813468 RepID=A0ABY7TMD2_9SPHN|nr:hypothetical protein [Sphingomonas naphthae]WCT73555.1 hypothetical protein PQ455_18420 [Sphingomonas naphthae]